MSSNIGRLKNTYDCLLREVRNYLPECQAGDNGSNCDKRLIVISFMFNEKKWRRNRLYSGPWNRDDTNEFREYLQNACPLTNSQWLKLNMDYDNCEYKTGILIVFSPPCSPSFLHSKRLR